ncbi:MAG TPA: DsrE family protein [Sediminibacterium sp.]|nr:DsrE family protein [Sediminibacterium sp.]
MRGVYLLAFLLFAQWATAQKTVSPLVKDFGPVFEVPFAVPVTDPKSDYKILVDVVTAGAKPEQINENLENVARIINLHALAGIPAKKIHVVAVIHGPAIMNILNNETYQQKLGVQNPNLPLLAALKQAGVQLYVCGQTLFKRNIDINTVSPDVKPSLSAITTISTFVARGYTVFKY